MICNKRGKCVLKSGRACTKDDQCASKICKPDYDKTGQWCAPADMCVHDGGLYKDGEFSPDCMNKTAKAQCSAGSWIEAPCNQGTVPCIEGKCGCPADHTKSTIRFFLLNQVKGQDYANLDDARFAIIEKGPVSNTMYGTIAVRKYSKTQVSQPYTTRKPIVFTNFSKAGDVIPKLAPDSLVGFFIPQGYKVYYFVGQVQDGSCKSPDWNKIKAKTFNPYDENVNSNDPKALFSLENLGINLSPDCINYPHGKCVNIYWRLVRQSDYKPADNLVEQLNVKGAHPFGPTDFIKTKTHSITLFNPQSNTGIRIGVNQHFGGLLTEISLGHKLDDGTKEFRQVLNTLSPTDSGFQATAHFYGVLVNGQRLHLAFNQECGATYRPGGTFQLNWAFESNINALSPTKLSGTTWMPLYSDFIRFLDGAGATVDTAPITNLKGY